MLFGAVVFVEHPLSLMQAGDENLPLVDEVCFFERYFNHLGEFVALKNSQKVLLCALHEHQCVCQRLQLSNQFHVPVKFLKWHLPHRQHFTGCFDNLPQTGHFFLEDAAKQLLLMLVDVSLVVGVDLLAPELLQPHLFLHLVLEDSELRGQTQGGEDGLLLLKGH